MHRTRGQRPLCLESAAGATGDCTSPGGRLLVHVARLGRVTALQGRGHLDSESLSPRQALICGEKNNPKHSTQVTFSCWCHCLMVSVNV